MSRKNAAKKRSAAVLFNEESSDEIENVQIQKQFNDSSTQTDQVPSTTETNNIDIKLNKVLTLLAHANSKLDAIGSGSSAECQHKFESVALRKISLDPVKTLEDLEALQKNCKREEFINETVASIGQLHGNNGTLHEVELFVCR